MIKEFDVIVLGGGPAGSVAAMFLAKAGKRVCLIEKANFPRDKICGDAQGRKAAGIMRKLGIYEEYEKLPGQKIYGITLSSPNGTQIEVDVEDRKNPAPGYVHKRIVFDEFLFKNAVKLVTELKNVVAKDVIVEDGCVKGLVIDNNGHKEEVRSKILIAADGATSIVAAKFKLNDNPTDHFISAIRGYYKNVSGMTDRIEIHMVDELIPGYFWIFPLPNNEANVGLGMIITDMAEKKINLKDAMIRAIEKNPLFKDRFKNSELVGDIKGWNLPLASHRRKIYGNGFILLGDAAGLIDPLSGEGVGTAMISGEVGANVAIDALNKEDVSEKYLKRYDKELWEIIGDEIDADYKVQRLGKKFPHLIDKLMVKASKDEKFRKEFEKMLPYTGGRKKLGTKEFIKLLL